MSDPLAAPGVTLASRLDALARRRAPRLLMVTDAAMQAMPRGRYPFRMTDGRRQRLHLGPSRTEPGETRLVEEIEGRTALIVDAGGPVERMAQRLAAAFRTGRRAA